ncbi:MAG: hypothetical protein AAFN40_25425 [Cyanobacteria bacterium J06560_6]
MLFARRILLAVCLLGAATPLTNQIISRPAIAQLVAQSAVPPSALPVCPPPASQEYLLLVRGETEAERARIATVLPVESTVLVCRYTDEIVVRAGGFTSLETANAWSTYLASVEGVESFVAQPAPVNQPAEPVATGSSSTVPATAYQPQQLGVGYAVLVEYGSRPKVATTVGQLVRPVGLAVYQQRAYLLAGYTADSAAASAILQRMSDAQLAAVMVPAQQVVRLTSEVSR